MLSLFLAISATPACFGWQTGPAQNPTFKEEGGAKPDVRFHCVVFLSPPPLSFQQ